MGPPADSAYAVEPLGVEKMIPSPIIVVKKLPFKLISKTKG